MEYIKRRIREISQDRKLRLMRRRFAMIVALIVIITTVSELILPGISMTTSAADAMSGLSFFKKTSDLTVAEKNGTDGQGKKVLICSLPEVEAHKHDSSCYEEQRTLICGKEESEGHKHSGACYEQYTELVCGKNEHTHDSSCYEDVVVDREKNLVCGYDEGEEISPAEYSEPVYSDPVIDEETGDVIEEAQLIEEARVIKEAEVHHHSDSCYEINEITESRLACGRDEHEHSKKCYETTEELVCGKAEGDAHKHTKDCYDVAKVLVCGQYEPHIHTLKCYETGKHGEDAVEMGWAHYETTTTSDRILVGGEEHLICEKPQVIVHHHTDKCYDIIDTNDQADRDNQKAEEENTSDTATKEVEQDADQNNTSGQVVIQDAEVPETGKVETERKVFFSDFMGMDDTDIAENAEETEDTEESELTEDAEAAEQAEEAEAAGQTDENTEEDMTDETAEAEQSDETEETAEQTEEAEEAEQSEDEENAEQSEEEAAEEAADEEMTDEEMTDETAEADQAEDTEETEENEETEELQGAAFTRVVEVAGAPYTLTITCDERCMIPENANIKARALSEEDAEYAEYEQRAHDAVRENEEADGFKREQTMLCLFDVIITDAYGIKIQPAAPLRVTVNFEDNTNQEQNSIYAVHFPGTGDAGTTSADNALKALTDKITVDQLLERIEQGEEEQNTSVEVIDTVSEGTEVSFTAEGFSLYAIVGTIIEKNVIASDGHNYRISVTYGPEAGIPADAVLDVQEVLENDERYDDHTERSAEAVGCTPESLQYLRMFDIRILSAAGEKIEPSAPVEVKVEYADAVELVNEAPVQIVHFANDGTELIDARTNLTKNGAVEDITFEAASFSVYSIVSSGDTAELGGKTYALINTYSGNAMTDTALDTKKLSAQTVQILDAYVKTNEEITSWTFTSAGGGRYYIQTQDGRYLNINATNNNGSVVISNTRQALNVTAGTGTRSGQVRITNQNGIAINNYSGSTAGGFGTYNDNGNNEWFTLYGLEEIVLNPAYAAEKISVQSIEDAQKVMIYRSVYNEVLKTYEDYVIDGTGTLVRAYDKGDQVTLRSAVSPFWTVTMHRDETTHELNGYYDFYNEETGLYLSPQSDGTLVSATRPGVTLNGRRDGEYISTIEKWDEAAWAWYGIQIVSNEFGDMTLMSGTGKQSQEFSFAVDLDQTADELHTVATVDSASNGITIHMFNYPDRKTISNVTGSDSYAVRVLPAQHVTAKLVNGYPVFANGKSGSTLFNTGSSYYKGDGNNLFLDSVYESTGYYEYNAFHNYAHYNASTGNFTVYQETGTPSNDNQFFYKRGNFFPYNDIDAARKATNVNSYKGDGNPLDIQDPTDGGTLYMINNPDFYFGMTMEANFLMPKNGYVKGSPVVYDFNGDDDLWIFIDDVLVLDIGGVHDAWPGAINFATGEIIGGNGGANGALTIKQAFKNAGVFPDGSAWDESKVDQYFNGNTFVDYGSHSFKMFYMEHGAGASNLEMRFNLPVIEKGKFTVEKQLDGTTQQKFANVYFAYQAFKREDGADVPLTDAVYEGTTNPVTFYPSVEIGGHTYTNVFYLKPGEKATFAEMPEDTEYYVQELGVGTDYYDQIIVNDVRIDGKEVTPTDGIYPTTVATVANRVRVTYTNHCSDKNLNDIRITKRLADGSLDDGSTFEFRVLIENASGVLAPYSTGEYYIQNDDGDYFKYVDGKLTNNGKTPIVASVAGNNGTIAGIPADYTVVIKDLLADTDFYVEEIRLPAGWELDSKKVVEGSCAASDLPGKGWAGDDVTADGQIILDKDAQIIFTNKGQQKLIVNKNWESGEFVAKHGDIHVALYKLEGDQLVLAENSVRTISAPATSVEYILSSLNGYVVREVMVEDGVATPAAEGGVITVTQETTTMGEGDNSYKVHYEQGEIRTEDESGAEITPTRTDTITNTLPDLTVNKTDMDKRQLAGAAFRLLKEDKETVVEGYEAIISNTEETGNLLNKVHFVNGVYYLEETKAPDGYILLDRLVRITVDEHGIRFSFEDGTAIANENTGENVEDPHNVTISIANNPGVTLPNAGGMGTTVFYILGTLLAVVSGVLLSVRRRMMA